MEDINTMKRPALWAMLKKQDSQWTSERKYVSTTVVQMREKLTQLSGGYCEDFDDSDDSDFDSDD